jgi:uncharacterized protein (DUF1501 family)
LNLVSQLLKSGSQARVYYTLHGGFDTHSNQLYTHASLLREFAEAMKAFLDDLRSAQLDDRVLVLAFSEFGRRVKENDSKGTDHGTAGPVFLAGSNVQAGLIGKPPSLTDLEDGDLKGQFDFRQIYSAILNDWLQIDALSVLEESFQPLPVLHPVA